MYVQNQIFLCPSLYRISHIRAFMSMLIDFSTLKRTLTPHRVSAYRVSCIITNFPLDLPQPKRTVPQVINTLLDLQPKPQTAKINRVQSGCCALCVSVCVCFSRYFLCTLDLIYLSLMNCELRQRQQQQLMKKALTADPNRTQPTDDKQAKVIK